MWILFIIFLVLSGADNPVAELITLDLAGTSEISRSPVLVRGFTALRQGACPGLSSMVVLDDRGGICPADLVATARYEDGSVRYLAVAAVVPGRLAQGMLKLRSGTKRRTADLGIRLTKQQAGGLGLDTGKMFLSIQPSGESLIHTMEMSGRAVFQTRKAMLLELHLGDAVYRAAPSKGILLKKGQAETEVIITGRTLSHRAELGPEYAVHLYLQASSPLIGCKVRISARAFEGRSEGLYLYFRQAFKGWKRKIRIMQDKTAHLFTLRKDDSFRLISGGEGLACLLADEETVLGPASSIALCMDGQGHDLSLGLPRFGSLHPWEVCFSRQKGLGVSLFSSAFQWEKGFVCEREFFIQAGPRAMQGAMAARMNGPVRAAAFGLPVRMAHRLLPFAPPLKDLGQDPLFPDYLALTDKLLARLAGERAFWDGYRDFGDYRTSFGQFANCEYDPAYGLLKRFLLTGSLADISTAEIMLKHWLRFDRTGPEESGVPAGIPWVHGIDHVSGEVEPGHMWVDGALLYWLMTGEIEYLEAVRAIGRYLASIGLEHLGDLRERSAGWSLMALTVLRECGVLVDASAMDRIAALIRRRQSSEGYFSFDTVTRDEARMISTNSWVTAGITMEALYRHYQLTRDDRSLEALLRASTWLKRSCLDPITGQWFQNLIYSPHDESRVVEGTGSVQREYLAFLALGLARAGFLEGDRHMMIQARGLLKRGIRELMARPPRYPGRALAVVMRCAPEVMLMTREAGRAK